MRRALPTLLLLVLAACEPGLSDDSDAGVTPPPTAEAQAWIDTQNAVRRAPQPPPPSPLPALTWSTAAAGVAGSWAAACNYQHNPEPGRAR